MTEDQQHEIRPPAVQKPLLKTLKRILINAVLLLVPSAVFILVRVNTIEKIVQWRPMNLVWFFLLYLAVLSIFAFEPHVWLFRNKFSQRLLRYGSQKIQQLSQINMLRILFILLVLILPWVVSRYQTKVLIYALSYFIFALGINFTVGYAGFLNLGHVLPFAAGAYTYALGFEYFSLDFYPALFLGAIAGGLVGGLMALVTLRLRGDYLGIVTLAMAEIFRLILVNWDSFTKGMRGVSGISPPSLPGIELSFLQKYYLLYYLALALAVVGYVMSSRMERSRFGRSWQALREDEIAAVSMGINAAGVRLSVFTIGGVYAGVAGVILSSSSTYVSPHFSNLLFSITVLSVVILGGMGSLRGIILGTVIIIIVPEYLRALQAFRLLIFGAILVLMMQYRPYGIMPQKRPHYAVQSKKKQEQISQE